jgi:FMN-dependent NADH-azoreductase
MTTLLKVTSSIYSTKGQSSLLADQLVAGWHAANPAGQVIARDLARDPVPHLTEERFSAFLAKPEARTPQQREVIACSDALIDELKRADVVVIALPLYNFGVPSTLQAYFDHIARAGVTFRYTEQGSVGLLPGKKVYVTAARGGMYAGTPADTQTAHVRTFLGLLGMTDVEFVYAEGLAISEAGKVSAIAEARQNIQSLNEKQWRVAA